MARKVLDNVKMSYSWTSYIAGVHGVLQAADMWKDELYKLMGMTGICFHFIIHKTACPSSVTVYDWADEHLAMMDRIGVHSDVYHTFNDGSLNTFRKRQEDAVQRIRESIDREIGVVVWAPSGILEFGIITGYDDEDGVFFVEECTGQKVDPLLYTNLGKSEVPFMFYQIFKDKVDVNVEKVYRESLAFGLREWNKEFHINPINPDYASGRKGYDNLMATLDRDDFDIFGLAYILVVYADSKRCISQYLNYLVKESKEIKGLENAAGLFEQIAGKFAQMTALFPFNVYNGAGGTADRSKAPELLRLTRECKQLEDEAMGVIAKALGR